MHAHGLPSDRRATWPLPSYVPSVLKDQPAVLRPQPPPLTEDITYNTCTRKEPGGPTSVKGRPTDRKAHPAHSGDQATHLQNQPTDPCGLPDPTARPQRATWCLPPCPTHLRGALHPAPPTCATATRDAVPSSRDEMRETAASESSRAAAASADAARTAPCDASSHTRASLSRPFRSRARRPAGVVGS
eukprot:365312-Chlamydomonas_euryale.AAC.6